MSSTSSSTPRTSITPVAAEHSVTTNSFSTRPPSAFDSSFFLNLEPPPLTTAAAKAATAPNEGPSAFFTELPSLPTVLPPSTRDRTSAAVRVDRVKSRLPKQQEQARRDTAGHSSSSCLLDALHDASPRVWRCPARPEATSSSLNGWCNRSHCSCSSEREEDHPPSRASSSARVPTSPSRDLCSASARSLSSSLGEGVAWHERWERHSSKGGRVSRKKPATSPEAAAGGFLRVLYGDSSSVLVLSATTHRTNPSAPSTHSHTLTPSSPSPAALSHKAMAASVSVVRSTAVQHHDDHGQAAEATAGGPVAGNGSSASITVESASKPQNPLIKHSSPPRAASLHLLRERRLRGARHRYRSAVSIPPRPSRLRDPFFGTPGRRRAHTTRPRSENPSSSSPASRQGISRRAEAPHETNDAASFGAYFSPSVVYPNLDFPRDMLAAVPVQRRTACPSPALVTEEDNEGYPIQGGTLPPAALPTISSTSSPRRQHRKERTGSPEQRSRSLETQQRKRQQAAAARHRMGPLAVFYPPVLIPVNESEDALPSSVRTPNSTSGHLSHTTPTAARKDAIDRDHNVKGDSSLQRETTFVYQSGVTRLRPLRLEALHLSRFRVRSGPLPRPTAHSRSSARPERKEEVSVALPSSSHLFTPVSAQRDGSECGSAAATGHKGSPLTSSRGSLSLDGVFSPSRSTSHVSIAGTVAALSSTPYDYSPETSQGNHLLEKRETAQRTGAGTGGCRVRQLGARNSIFVSGSSEAATTTPKRTTSDQPSPPRLTVEALKDSSLATEKEQLEAVVPEEDPPIQRTVHWLHNTAYKDRFVFLIDAVLLPSSLFVSRKAYQNATYPSPPSPATHRRRRPPSPHSRAPRKMPLYCLIKEKCVCGAGHHAVYRLVHLPPRRIRRTPYNDPHESSSTSNHHPHQRRHRPFLPSFTAQQRAQRGCALGGSTSSRRPRQAELPSIESSPPESEETGGGSRARNTCSSFSSSVSETARSSWTAAVGEGGTRVSPTLTATSQSSTAEDNAYLEDDAVGVAGFPSATAPEKKAPNWGLRLVQKLLLEGRNVLHWLRARRRRRRYLTRQGEPLGTFPAFTIANSKKTQLKQRQKHKQKKKQKHRKKIKRVEEEESVRLASRAGRTSRFITTPNASPKPSVFRAPNLTRDGESEGTGEWIKRRSEKHQHRNRTPSQDSQTPPPSHLATPVAHHPALTSTACGVQDTKPKETESEDDDECPTTTTSCSASWWARAVAVTGGGGEEQLGSSDAEREVRSAFPVDFPFPPSPVKPSHLRSGPNDVEAGKGTTSSSNRRGMQRQQDGKMELESCTSSSASSTPPRDRWVVEVVEILHDDLRALDYHPELLSTRLALETRVVRTVLFPTVKDAWRHYCGKVAEPTRLMMRQSGLFAPWKNEKLSGDDEDDNNDEDISPTSCSHSSSTFCQDTQDEAPSSSSSSFSNSFTETRAVHSAALFSSTQKDKRPPPRARRSSVCSIVGRVVANGPPVGHPRRFSATQLPPHPPQAAEDERGGEDMALEDVFTSEDLRNSSVFCEREGASTPYSPATPLLGHTRVPSLSASPPLPLPIPYHLCESSPLFPWQSEDSMRKTEVQEQGSSSSQTTPVEPSNEHRRAAHLHCKRRAHSATFSCRKEGVVAPHVPCREAFTFWRSTRDTIVTLYSIDPHFNSVLREILVPSTSGAVSVYTSSVESQQRLLRLYESGIPSWCIFAAGMPGMVYRHEFRLLYVIVQNVSPLVSLAVGFWDLYKHLPHLKGFLARTIDPITQWIDERLTLRVSLLGTYLLSTVWTIYSSLSLYWVVPISLAPMIRLLFWLLRLPFTVAFQTLWRSLTAIFVLVRVALHLVIVLLTGPFKILRYGVATLLLLVQFVFQTASLALAAPLALLRWLYDLYLSYSAAPKAAAAATVEVLGKTSALYPWWRAWTEFWATVASPITNLVKAIGRLVLHVALGLLRREASLRRWYAAHLPFLYHCGVVASDVLYTNWVILKECSLPNGMDSLLVAMQVMVFLYFYWYVFEYYSSRGVRNASGSTVAMPVWNTTTWQSAALHDPAPCGLSAAEGSSASGPPQSLSCAAFPIVCRVMRQQKDGQ